MAAAARTGSATIAARGRSRSAAGSRAGARSRSCCVLIVVFFVVWGAVGFLSFRSGVNAANKRLSDNARAALNPQGGLLLSHSSDILLLGTDHADNKTRAGDQHSDSIMLVRSDPHRHRITFLSIARDLRVPIPATARRRSTRRTRSAGPALAIKTVRDFTGLPVNHVVARRLRRTSRR